MSAYKNLGLVLIVGIALFGIQTSQAQTNEELQMRISELEERLLAMEDLVANNTVLRLDGYLNLDDSDPARPTALFAGVNIQVVNGLGETNTINGLGNMIIGYDESYPSSGSAVCSRGNAVTRNDCVSQGNVWSLNHKSGSHNLVAGRYHRYSQYSGLVVGSGNTITGPYATVSGGVGNTASTYGATVSGGHVNSAHGDYSSVTGGYKNIARVARSSVNGGVQNLASGVLSTISGGQRNETNGHFTTIVGGYGNYARRGSTVSGGMSNKALGAWSSISGGEYNTARGERSSISGGSNRNASGESDWVAGSLFQDN